MSLGTYKTARARQYAAANGGVDDALLAAQRQPRSLIPSVSVDIATLCVVNPDAYRRPSVVPSTLPTSGGPSSASVVSKDEPQRPSTPPMPQQHVSGAARAPPPPRRQSITQAVLGVSDPIDALPPPERVVVAPPPPAGGECAAINMPSATAAPRKKQWFHNLRASTYLEQLISALSPQSMRSLPSFVNFSSRPAAAEASNSVDSTQRAEAVEPQRMSDVNPSAPPAGGPSCGLNPFTQPPPPPLPAPGFCRSARPRLVGGSRVAVDLWVVSPPPVAAANGAPRSPDPPPPAVVSVAAAEGGDKLPQPTTAAVTPTTTVPVIRRLVYSSLDRPSEDRAASRSASPTRAPSSSGYDGTPSSVTSSTVSELSPTFTLQLADDASS